VVDDYDAWLRDADDLAESFGSVARVPLVSAGRVVGVIGIAEGETGRRFGERELATLVRFARLASIALENARLLERAQTEGRERAHAALHDLLTGLPNRDLLMGRVALALEEARLAGPKGGDGDGAAARHAACVGFALLDIDRFQVVNETLGHVAGDRLLDLVGRRLVATVREGDVVARFGGDVFGILLYPIDGPLGGLTVTAAIEAAFAAPFQLGDAEAHVTASVGVALGGATTSIHDLLREAEIALHQAKLDATRHTVLFDPTMRAQTLERVDLELDLRRALERDELRLHYQPLIDLRTDRVVGTEALVRWQHPTRGLVPPLAFVPLAEETGLILRIGHWVLQTACAQARAWQREQADGAPIVMSVNLSARQFSQAGLVDEVAALLAATGLPPQALELEITESVVMDETEAGIARLHALRDLGVRLVLDDFGTGYSSLSYLRRLPLDAIKIDRSFVMGLGTAEADARSSDLPIVQAVIALAHALGIEVVAEGIETPEQLRLLRSLGCDRGQGFLFARPLVPAEAARTLGRSIPL